MAALGTALLLSACTGGESAPEAPTENVLQDLQSVSALSVTLDRDDPTRHVQDALQPALPEGTEVALAGDERAEGGRRVDVVLDRTVPDAELDRLATELATELRVAEDEVETSTRKLVRAEVWVETDDEVAAVQRKVVRELRDLGAAPLSGVGVLSPQEGAVETTFNAALDDETTLEVLQDNLAEALEVDPGRIVLVDASVQESPTPSPTPTPTPSATPES